MRKLLYVIIALAFCQLTIAQNYPNGMPMHRTCGTQPPSAQWDAWFNQKVTEFLQNNAGKFNSLNTSAAIAYTIPVIVHVIHGGQAIGTYPNLSNAQVVSQINILTNDFSGTGQYVGNYPATAFAGYAATAPVTAPSFNGTRIIIGNAQLTFLPCQYDKNGNAMPEPGVDRVNFNTFTLSAGYTSKDPANAAYNTNGTFQNFINNIVKPQTIWDVNKYMNIWTTDENAALGLLGFATFPPGSTLPGIPGGTGTSTTDGLWCWGRAYGNTGFALAPYNLGRTATHEIGHWLGLRHIWGDGNCVTDYCQDTPPANGPNYVNQNNLATPPTATNANTATYPLKPNTCVGPPANGPNGQMFMNFMDYSDDNGMYMYTTDQVNRMQTAMANSPIRVTLGTHGLTVPPPVANFTFTPTSPCAGQSVTVTSTSTGGATQWTYTFTGASLATSTLQNPVVTFTGTGTQSITLIAIANGTQVSLPVTKTVNIGTGLSVNIAATNTIICSGSSVTLTASGATSYLWNTGATSAAIVVSPTTTTNYTVTGTTGACNGTKTISISVNTTPTLTANNATICSGSSATLTASGATSYSWNPGGLTGASIVVSPTSTTVYTITGANGTCTSSITRTVTVNTTPTVTVSASANTICSGVSTTITALGATSYSWNTGALTGGIAVSPSSTTSYTVTGTSAGCSNTKTISITVNPTPTLTVNSATICSGGSATLTANGTVSYTWNPGPLLTASVVVSPTATTVYTVTGFSGSCVSFITSTVTVNASPTVNVNANPTSICSGASATLNATGATSYSWNTGATLASIVVTPSVTTTYSVTGTSGSCSNTKTVSVNVTTTPTVSVNSFTICPGGSATLSASGATTYSWNTGATSSNITVSPAATTVYTVTGFNGTCSNVKTVTVTIGTGLSIAVSPSNPSICQGASATLTASGATTYTWNPGNIINSSIVVSPTTTSSYTVIGTSGACSGTTIVTVTVTPNPTVSINPIPSAICSGSSSTLTALGASTYSWNTGATSSVIVVSPAITTNYTVTGFTSGCSNTKTVAITVNASPTVSVNNATVCSGASANLTASGASTYSWNTGATTASITVSPVVTTVYTVTGFNGACSNVKTATVIVNSNPITTTSQTNVSCFGACNGSIVAVGSGALAPYNYVYSPSGPNNVCAGTYTVITASANGCSTTNTVNITQPANTLNVVVSNVAASCATCANGAASSTVSGGTASYNYLWQPSGGAAANATNLIPGCYTLTVTDANNCSTTATTCVGFNTSIRETTAQILGVSIIPNPHQGAFSISFANDGEKSIEVYDAVGRIVMTKMIINKQANFVMTDYANGLYYIKVKTSEGSAVYKMVKE
jgi:PKD repeat protein